MIIFSAYIPNESKLYVLDEFLQLANKYHAAEPIYIGFQVGSDYDASLKHIAKYNLNIKTGLAKQELYVNSDATGYQKAIELYANDKRVDNSFIYFGHTKSVTTNNHTYRYLFYKEIFANRPVIESQLGSSKTYGIYGYSISPIVDYTDKPFPCKLKDYSTVLKYQPMNYLMLHTFYVFKSYILNNFLDTVDNSFFTTNLTQLSDRYFFERDFPHISDMQGFYPTYNNIAPNFHSKTMPDENDMNRVFRSWHRYRSL